MEMEMTKSENFWAFVVRLNLNQFSFNLGKCLNELKQATNAMGKFTCWKNRKTGKTAEKKNPGKLLKMKSINNKCAQLNSMCTVGQCGRGGVACTNAKQAT